MLASVLSYSIQSFHRLLTLTCKFVDVATLSSACTDLICLIYLSDSVFTLLNSLRDIRKLQSKHWVYIRLRRTSSDPKYSRSHFSC